MIERVPAGQHQRWLSCHVPGYMQKNTSKPWIFFIYQLKPRIESLTKWQEFLYQLSYCIFFLLFLRPNSNCSLNAPHAKAQCEPWIEPSGLWAKNIKKKKKKNPIGLSYSFLQIFLWIFFDNWGRDCECFLWRTARDAYQLAPLKPISMWLKSPTLKLKKAKA